MRTLRLKINTYKHFKYPPLVYTFTHLAFLRRDHNISGECTFHGPTMHRLGGSMDQGLNNEKYCNLLKTNPYRRTTHINTELPIVHSQSSTTPSQVRTPLHSKY